MWDQEHVRRVNQERQQLQDAIRAKDSEITALGWTIHPIQNAYDNAIAEVRSAKYANFGSPLKKELTAAYWEREAGRIEGQLNPLKEDLKTKEAEKKELESELSRMGYW